MTRENAAVGARMFDEPMNELGFYGLAGAPDNPRQLLVEASEAERIGLGSTFISERFNVQESATVAGMLGASTTRLGIAVAATNHNIRHPVVAAAHGLTMHKVTGGRFSLGLGRGTGPRAEALGLRPVTTAQMADFAWLLRRLWAGETVVDHDGPAGRFPRLSLGQSALERIPLTLTAFGHKTLTMGGRVFDSVVLHPFFSEETTRRAVAIVRSAAEKSGRDPASVRIWAVLATVAGNLSACDQRRSIVGRLATSLQSYGDLLVETNNWDPAVLDRFNGDLFVRSFDGPIHGRASDSELDHVATLLPDEWLAASASGTAAQCAAKVARQFDYGVDGVVFHGASPWELEPIVDEYRRCRNGARFDRLGVNPAAVRRRSRTGQHA